MPDGGAGAAQGPTVAGSHPQRRSVNPHTRQTAAPAGLKHTGHVHGTPVQPSAGVADTANLAAIAARSGRRATRVFGMSATMPKT